MKNIIKAIIFFIIISTFISWPLILNLDGFLLTNDFKDTSHSDINIMIKMMKELQDLYKQDKPFFVVRPYDIPLTYAIPGIFFMSYLNMSEIVYTNIHFLVSIFLSGLFMYLLTFEITNDHNASIYSGFIFITSNYLLQQYIWGHIPYYTIQWLPLIFLLLEKSLKSKNVKYSFYLGISLTVQILSSAQYTIYLTFILILYIILKNLFEKRNFFISLIFWKKIIISALTTIILSSFYLVQRLKINAPIRSIQENLGFSWGFGKHMNFLSYFSFDTKIYFGQIQFLIFIISGYILLNNKNNKKFKQYFIYFILCIIIVLLIMGPNTYVSPYYLLYTFWPFINRVGYPDRLFPFLLLFSGLSSGILFKYINKNKNLKKHKHAILIIIILSIMISQILRSPWFRNHWIFFP